MTLYLTRDEAAALEAEGRVVLFRAGECIHIPHHDNPSQCESLPPAEFVEAAQPCQTCGGYNINPNSVALRPLCPDCLGGRRRITAVVPCEHPTFQFVRGRTAEDYLCLSCRPDGFATFATVVVKWGPLVVVGPRDVGDMPCAFVSGNSLIVAVTGDEHGWYYRRTTLPPDVDPQTLVGQYALDIRKVDQ